MKPSPPPSPSTEPEPPTGTTRDSPSAFTRLRVLVVRELGDAWRERRLLLGGIFCLLLAAAAGFSEGHRLVSVRGEEQLLSANWAESVREQALRSEPMEIPSVRTASALSPLANGLESVLPQRFFSTKERLRYGEGRAARSTIEALSGPFDASFVIAVAFSLLAIVLTYDAISGERASGTLSLLLSYPVSRRLLFVAKAAGAIGILWFWLLGALVVIAGAMLVSGLPLASPVRWLMLLGVGAAYLAAWALITLAVSAATRRPAVSLLVALVLWATLVLIVPRLVAPTLSRGWGSERLVRVALMEETENQQLRQEYQQKVNRLFGRFALVGLGDETAREQFAAAQQEAQEELDQQRRELSERIWEEQRRIERAMEEQALWLSALSPTAMFERAASEISQTGFRQRELFYSEARGYYHNIGVRLAESRPLFMNLDQGTKRGVAYGPSEAAVLDRIEPNLIQFETPWTTVSQTAEDIAVPLGLLLVYCVAATGLGIGAARRLDPRP